MRTIKVPNAYDMNICMKKESLKETKSCPWCGSTEIERDRYPSIIKIKDGIFKKKSMLEYKCRCRSCGGKYATKPYPIEAESPKPKGKSFSKLCISVILFIPSAILSIIGVVIDNPVVCATTFGFSVGVLLALVLFLICDSYEESLNSK